MKKTWTWQLLPVALVALGWLVTASSSEAARKKKGDPAALFAKIDTNNDKKISKAEWEAFWKAKEAKRAAKGKPARGKADKSALFAKLDTDNDGYLTLEEFKKIKDGKGKKKKP